LILYLIGYSMNVFCLQSSAHPEAFAGLLERLIAEENEDTLARILTTIAHVANIGGHPQEPAARRLSGMDMCEIRSKYRRGELIRIYYFVDKEKDRMLLLNSIVKPDGSSNPSHYEGNAGKRLTKELQKSITIALRLKDLFPPSSPHYDPLPSLL
jgi:hypothetical protein